MKNKILSLITIAFVALGLSSCGDEPNYPGIANKGDLSLSSMSLDVTHIEKIVGRASIDVSDFIVEIYNESNARVSNWKYSDMPEIISLPVGKYSVKVYSHEIKKAAWDEPYYEGTKEFEIKDNQITEIGVVTCKFSSLRVSIRFDESFMKHVNPSNNDIKVEVSANDEGRLTFTTDETRSGYFQVIPGSTSVAVVLTGTINGNFETVATPYTDVEPGQHRIITFYAKNADPTPPQEYGNIDGSGVQVDYTIKDEYVDGGYNNSEDAGSSSDRPGQENFNDPDPGQDPNPGQDPDPGQAETITFTSPTLFFDKPNTVSDDLEGIVYIHADKGVEHLNVKIESDNANFVASAGEMLPLSFDLAYPGAIASDLQSLGFPVGSDVIGKSDITFDITTFIPLLAAFPGQHTFTISVTDGDNVIKNAVLIFIAQ